MHKWDVLEDMVVFTAVVEDTISDKKYRKKICKMFNITESQLMARANNYMHILLGRTSFWHTSKQERMVVDVMKKHKALMKI
jgi:hypothetical protein